MLIHFTLLKTELALRDGPSLTILAVLTSGNDLKKFTKPFCCGASAIKENMISFAMVLLVSSVNELQWLRKRVLNISHEQQNKRRAPP
jgi:hypothetical protein